MEVRAAFLSVTRRLEETFEQDLLHCREMTLKDVQSVGPRRRFRDPSSARSRLRSEAP